MRVISGKYRSLVLSEFKGTDIRPTADRVKESLFNILFSVQGARVLDLFCGSGSLGVECISRGAAFVQFNDASKESISVLYKNLSKLRGERGYAVSCLDFKEALLSQKEGFDLIFIDPPYALPYGEEALNIISQKNLLSAGGKAVYERDRAFKGEIFGLKMFDERKYGKTYISFFEVAK